MFDDAVLSDPAALAADPTLRRLAEAGGRVRIEAEATAAALEALTDVERPRAVVAVGEEARLVRALLEPACPVPFVAWPHAGLPAWVGPLDLVVVLAPGHDADGEAAEPEVGPAATVGEAARRGARVLLAAAAGSPLIDLVGRRTATVLPTRTGDALAAGIMVAAALRRLDLGPPVHPDGLAAVLDDIAERCSPYVEVTSNPGKELALELADAHPLLWGGSTLAARAARRVAEALRSATGRPALAADADALAPVIAGAEARDPFADPFADPLVDGGGVTPPRPGLVVLDDGLDDAWVARDRRRLTTAADDHEVRVSTLRHDEGDELTRYAALRHLGLYGAAYLGLGSRGSAAGPTDRQEW